MLDRFGQIMLDVRRYIGEEESPQTPLTMAHGHSLALVSRPCALAIAQLNHCQSSQATAPVNRRPTNDQ